MIKKWPKEKHKIWKKLAILGIGIHSYKSILHQTLKSFIHLLYSQWPCLKWATAQLAATYSYLHRCFLRSLYWGLLLAAECKNYYPAEVIILETELTYSLMAVSTYITGTPPAVLPTDALQHFHEYKKDLTQAHLLCREVTKMLQEYPIITGHPIAQSTVEQLYTALTVIRKNIDHHVAQGPDRILLDEAYNSLIAAFPKPPH